MGSPILWFYITAYVLLVGAYLYWVFNDRDW